MRRMAISILAGAFAFSSYGDAPVVQTESRGFGIRGPITYGRTYSSGIAYATRRSFNVNVQPMEPPPKEHKHREGFGHRSVVVAPAYTVAYGGYYNSDAEWAKVRLMEEELRLKEEQSRLDHELKLAQLEAQKNHLFVQDQRTSWDRAVAMYPPLVDPRSKIRIWYDHLLKRAMENTDRWGIPSPSPELDSPDYPEIFAHRAAAEVGLVALPIPPVQKVAVAETVVAPSATTTTETEVTVGEEIPGK